MWYKTSEVKPICNKLIVVDDNCSYNESEMVLGYYDDTKDYMVVKYVKNAHNDNWFNCDIDDVYEVIAPDSWSKFDKIDDVKNKYSWNVYPSDKLDVTLVDKEKNIYESDYLLFYKPDSNNNVFHVFHGFVQISDTNIDWYDNRDIQNDICEPVYSSSIDNTEEIYWMQSPFKINR